MRSFLVVMLYLLYKIGVAQGADIFGANRMYPIQLKEKLYHSLYEDKSSERLTTLNLNKNNSFTYTSISASGTKILIGGYRFVKDTLFLAGDSAINYSALKDSLFIQQHSNAEILSSKGSGVKYVYSSKRKELRQPLSKYDIVEIYFSPSQVSSGGYIIDSLAFFAMRFNARANKLVVKTVNQKLKFPLDSVWGYKIYSPSGKGGSLRRVRGVGGRGLPIVQNDNIIVYRATNGRQFFFYLSKTLDSEIFVFNKKMIKLHFADNPRFLQLIDQTKNWGEAKTINGALKFIIVDLYNKSIEQTN